LVRISDAAGYSGYLYLNLFPLPNLPIWLSGDQTFFWMNGQRMLHGERPYLDFFQFTPPGADIFYFALFKAFGPRIWPFLHQASKCDSPLLQRLGFHGCNGHPDTRTQSSKISNRGSFAGLGTVNK
jgi:hypothetical protein